MGRLLAVVAASLTVIATSAVAVCAPAGAEPDLRPVGSVEIPDGPAQGWIVADIDTGTVLAGREMYGARPPASTIKVLLALTALDELNLDSTVVASPAAANAECNCAGLTAGRTYTVRQLLEAALLVSGNDAAHALADMLGGYDIAVDKMNAKAFAVGASDTHATSPSGLDGPGGAGWTTPRDLAVIFRAAMANPVFAQITAQPTAVFPADAGERVLVGITIDLAGCSQDDGAVEIIGEETPTQAMWREALAYFREIGTPEAKARPLVGRLLKSAKGDPYAVVNVVRASRRAQPHDAFTWMTKTLTSAGAQNGSGIAGAFDRLAERVTGA